MRRLLANLLHLTFSFPLLLRLLSGTEATPLLLAETRRIDPPAAAESGMPFFTQDQHGNILLAWSDTLGAEGHALRFSRWMGKSWSAPETITKGNDWFANWADFGSLNVLPDGSMLAHWLTRSAPENKYGYGIRVTRRDPKTGSWQQVHGMSLDEQQDYAGFLSFAPGTGYAAYLSPPAHSGHGAAHGNGDHDHRKTLRFLRFGNGGKPVGDEEIDADVCSCCPTATGRTRDGWVVAYRDHRGEVRDISVLRNVNGKWSEPRTVHADNWKINGCPTDGPSLVARDERVAVTWTTRAGGVAKVQAALSANQGEQFQAPVSIDDGSPLGRPVIAAFDGASYLLAWLERQGDGVELRLRRLTHAGDVLPSFVAAKVPLGRASGFPKIAVTQDAVFVAWRDQRVRVLLLPKEEVLRRSR